MVPRHFCRHCTDIDADTDADSGVIIDWYLRGSAEQMDSYLLGKSPEMSSEGQGQGQTEVPQQVGCRGSGPLHIPKSASGPDSGLLASVRDLELEPTKSNSLLNHS